MQEKQRLEDFPKVPFFLAHPVLCMFVTDYNWAYLSY